MRVGRPSVNGAGRPRDRRHSQAQLPGGSGFTSLKKRAGVKGLVCPLWGVFGPGLGMPAGGPETGDLEAGPSPAYPRPAAGPDEHTLRQLLRPPPVDARTAATP